MEYYYILKQLFDVMIYYFIGIVFIIGLVFIGISCYIGLYIFCGWIASKIKNIKRIKK